MLLPWEERKHVNNSLAAGREATGRIKSIYDTRIGPCRWVRKLYYTTPSHHILVPRGLIYQCDCRVCGPQTTQLTLKFDILRSAESNRQILSSEIDKLKCWIIIEEQNKLINCTICTIQIFLLCSEASFLETYLQILV